MGDRELENGISLKKPGNTLWTAPLWFLWGSRVCTSGEKEESFHVVQKELGLAVPLRPPPHPPACPCPIPPHAVPPTLPPTHPASPQRLRSPPWGGRQMDCRYMCRLSLGNLAKKPTEHKNRKMLFRETGYRANTAENTSRSSPTACPHKNILTASVFWFSTQPKRSHLSKTPQNAINCSQAMSRSTGTVPRLQGQVCP